MVISLISSPSDEKSLANIEGAILIFFFTELYYCTINMKKITKKKLNNKNKNNKKNKKKKIKKLNPTRYGDWEIKGRCIDF